MKACMFANDGSGKPVEGVDPRRHDRDGDTAREALIEMVAEADEALMEKFFDAGTLSQEELVAGLEARRAGAHLPGGADLGDRQHRHAAAARRDRRLRAVAGGTAVRARTADGDEVEIATRRRPGVGVRVEDGRRSVCRPHHAVPRGVRHAQGGLDAAQHRPRGAVRFVAIAAAICFVATGGWIFYNTKVLNTVRSENDGDRLQADYEKTYKKFEKQPEPRITDVKYAIDLYPESRNMTMRGQQTIVNQTSKPLTEIHFTLDKDYQATIEIPGANLSQDDRRLGYQVYTLTTPMQPGETRVMQFTMKTVIHGFENSLTNHAVLPNGTFIHSRIVPQIGYQPATNWTTRTNANASGSRKKT